MISKTSFKSLLQMQSYIGTQFLFCVWRCLSLDSAQWNHTPLQEKLSQTELTCTEAKVCSVILFLFLFFIFSKEHTDCNRFSSQYNCSAIVAVEVKQSIFRLYFSTLHPQNLNISFKDLFILERCSNQKTTGCTVFIKLCFVGFVGLM